MISEVENKGAFKEWCFSIYGTKIQPWFLMDVSIFFLCFWTQPCTSLQEKTIDLQNVALNLQRYIYASVVSDCFCWWKIWPPFWRMHEISTKQILIYIKQWSYAKHSWETRIQLKPHSYHAYWIFFYLFRICSCSVVTSSVRVALSVSNGKQESWPLLLTAVPDVSQCKRFCLLELHKRTWSACLPLGIPQGLSDKNELDFHYR